MHHHVHIYWLSSSLPTYMCVETTVFYRHVLSVEECETARYVLASLTDFTVLGWSSPEGSSNLCILRIVKFIGGFT